MRDAFRLVSPIPQRYNLKAIHNDDRRFLLLCKGVTNTSKIQSESKIDGVKAIHNRQMIFPVRPLGVTNTSKILDNPEHVDPLYGNHIKFTGFGFLSGTIH